MPELATIIPNNVNLDDIVDGIKSANVYGLAHKTPLEPARRLSDELGSHVYLKREDLQDVFSFKIRGASNRLSSLTLDEKRKGVVAASAGNHAQGIAASASQFGTHAVIFMPVTTPRIKIEAVQALGGDVRLAGDQYDAAHAAALAYAQETGGVFVHPFDDLDVIAGQGTIGREILDTLGEKPLDAIYIAVGGGGLLAGIGAWIRTYSPQTRIIAVEPAGAATLAASLEAGAPTPLDSVDGFADGVAVKMIGRNTFEFAKQIDPDLVQVSNDEICAAVRDIFEQTRTMVEPAGALALAGLRRHDREGRLPSGNVVAIVSGANVNFDRIGHIVERAELGAGGEILFAASLPERRGAFLEFCESLGTHAISEFNYRYADENTAHVLVGAKIKSPEEGASLMDSIRAKGMEVTDLSHNRLAKAHLRHMVGGRPGSDVPERLFSFEFPERPGALRDFLTALDNRWNISLFHYRNHGSSQGEVLCGFQLPDNDGDALEASLNTTGFAMRDESDNPAYQYFLKM